MAFGGIWGSLIGGYTLNNLRIDQIFLFFSLLPAIQLLSCGLVEESPVGDKVISVNGRDFHGDISRSQNDNSEKSKSNTLRRKRSQKSTEQGAETARKPQVPEARGSLAGKWLQSLKMATLSLFGAFRKPMILR